MNDSLDSINSYNTKCNHFMKCKACKNCGKCKNDGVEWCEIRKTCKKKNQILVKVITKYMKTLNVILNI